MRLTPYQIETISKTVKDLAGSAARVWLFGSRVDDQRRGGDVDLLVQLDAPVAEPAALAARLSARVSRSMYGRRVDVLLQAPNLAELPIHHIAMAQGVRL